MHAHIAAWCAVVLLLTCVTTICAAAASADPAALPSAAATPADKDHPHGFDPSRYPDRAAWEKRADFLRTQALVAQGMWPMPPRTPLEPVVHGRIDRGKYTVEKVSFASLPGHYVTGNLYRPTGRGSGKRPAVLMPYGHWPSGRFIWRDDAGVKKDLDSGAEKDPVAARSPLQANCVQLARMGCVVFHYDMVGYGDSTKIAHREGFTDAEAVMRLQSFMGLQTWNSIRALDFVLSLAEVDAKRVAVAGSSGGGTQAIALAAVDKERVAAAFPMVMVSMNMQGGCVCENAPLWRVHTNNVELASLFAPRPQGMAAANDWTHDFLQRGLPEMKTVWGFYGAAENVAGEHFDYPHNHNLHSRLSQYRFLNQHLHLGVAEPIAEKPFEPIPPEQLSVFDAEHPRPADEADAAAIRKWMTKTSDEQLAKLSDEQYVRTVRAALRAMIVDDDAEALPEPQPLRPPDVDPGDGRVLIWAHPDGGNHPQVKALREAGRMVLVVDSTPAAAPATKVSDPKQAYAGFTLGYNRGPIAERAVEMLDLIRRARREGASAVSVLAVGPELAPAALIACAIAGDAVDRAAIDLAGFDFNRVRDAGDPMLLPGALKYCGVHGLLPLCGEVKSMEIYGAAESRDTGRAAPPGVTLSARGLDLSGVIRRE